ncbi:prepilin-type N-terminal cleavage/methylation domain-containing protein [Candidatus Riflebacteria bacterium]
MVRKSFTLVELTIVLAVIAMIIGIATLKFGVITEEAKKTNCVANQKTLSGAIAVYDSRNASPFPDDSIKTDGTATTAGESLASLVSDTGVFSCPSSSGAAQYQHSRAGDAVNKYYAGITCLNYGKTDQAAGPDGTAGTIHR